jgi:predicted DNA-binding transcriptional regulator AlpA
MQKILLSAVEAAAYIGVCERKFHSLRHELGFPAPVSLGKRALRWRVNELENYVNGLPAAKPAPSPSQLLTRTLDRAMRSKEARTTLPNGVAQAADTVD